ncbi:thiopeptide-type bacteriocin biosynthesis protein [Streptomyces ipomoeae]|uniref:Thiopeptide-type bacteriocin biosynthesis domain protein n=1 Tax=Streptomyces ipomoeae 91-03 TaxID=698759 RepID=L1KWH3_9ACTN|nr:thiopeptide-type bacteriocin biosynthesis protein [Streptomyces ipomoeae]EKX65181.1 thiopeptide-type bacteriocin biosynthesis domain protein [Streptomyces ipomoeae 91-03]MDX2692431.1 thiopeptide-type bacteriocin biosynthesis protein [Streptomyces ipomoeae]MDX2838045.1 thiopeptide-type bacteriocin biosynthesis protein [Streptomyces ipomoeae]
MDPHDSTTIEQAVLAVLTGTPIAEAAEWAGSSPEHLAEATARYRSAGRTALSAPPDTSIWHQVNIEFADYPTAEHTFLAYLLPPLRQETEAGTVGAWWFIRKYPCWRLRVISGRDSTCKELPERLTGALDSAVARGAVKRWCPMLYEPETTAFGGPEGIKIAHDLFHVDSVGSLDYPHRTRTADDKRLDANSTSLLVISANSTSLLVISSLLRAAGQEWSEQGDVWARVEAKRPLPDDVPVDRVTAMTSALRALLAIDTRLARADMEQLAPYTDWLAGMERNGQALAHAGNAGRLGLGIRGILARHVVFHWNRMGFTTRRQAIWARAARETILGN